MPGNLGDIRRLIPDALHVGDHLQRRGHHAQIPGHRLLLQKQLHTQAFNLPLLLVNLPLNGDGLSGHFVIVLQKGLDARRDGLLALGPHPRQLQVQPLQLLVKSAPHQPNLPVM